MKRKIGVLLVTVFFILNTFSFAQDAELTNIIITNSQDDLLLHLTVDGAFRDKMESAILSGLPATFSFFITLSRVRNLWIDKTIASLKVTHTIKYDNLKKEFTVTRTWDNRKPIVTASFAEAKSLMSEIDNLKIATLMELEKGKQYQIKAKAELSKMTLPFYLHHVLFFLSLWDFETDWYTIDFVY